MKTSEIAKVIRPGDMIVWAANGDHRHSGSECRSEFHHISKDGKLIAFPFTRRDKGFRIVAGDVKALYRWDGDKWVHKPVPLSPIIDPTTKG
jgi:hypothetical protein